MTNPQHLTALAEANRVKAVRGRYRNDVIEGRIDLATLILDPPYELRRLPVLDALMWEPRFGRYRALRLLNQARYRAEILVVPENKPLGDLTTRQRVAVALTLREARLPAAERDAA